MLKTTKTICTKKFFCEGVWQNKLRNHLFKPFIANMVAPENNAMLRQKVCHQSQSYSNLSISIKLKINLVPTQWRFYKTSLFMEQAATSYVFVWLETLWQLDNVCFCQKYCYVNCFSTSLQPLQDRPLSAWEVFLQPFCNSVLAKSYHTCCVFWIL